ncbi:HAD hydrolase-like protein [Limobrevibacterium gyesilva]|uniref:HAD hydrolase-like protein n=1 Tax=Limobrevibacterium gyesilva TaxID=2991712 RepID=A0AA42CFT8_9PROT|nr:HAD hydrolase-like protein [Limobrevibacterium gyesilva]MCW3473342.1 HAD hydrolase-like protein [Limobrevibacterium gyesilva]
MNGPAALFDLDGTLTDSRPGIVGSIHAALRSLGHVPDPRMDLTRVIGPPLDEVIAHVLDHYGDTRTAEAITLYRGHYGETGLFDNALYPDIQAALAEFVAAGFTLYVATSKRTLFARRILEHFGISGCFRGIYGSEDGGALDHKPELLGHILRREPIRPPAAVMIGDRRQDIAGAHANGMRAIGVTWGYGDAGELEQAGADALAHAASDLLSVARALVQSGSVR